MEIDQKKPIKKIIAIILSGVLILSFVIYFLYFSAPQKNREVERFIVALNDDQKSILNKLDLGGFLKSPLAFNFISNFRGLNGKLVPGGYKISKSMNVWQVSSVLLEDPYMKWVVIPEGLRKEEIANLLGEGLDWSDAQKNQWIKTDTTKKSDYIEGVYFPDTYLISKDETTSQVADRLISHFEEKFAPYLKEAVKQNIKWTTVIKLASIIQREAFDKNDMPLISGILWNRLLNGQRLEVDSTLQYIRGNTPLGWWAPITIADKKIDSAFNTYLNKGLPPTPIANPGIEAISSVLKPLKTDCLFYLHDKKGVIHCSKTYEGHLKNIEEYLK